MSRAEGFPIADVDVAILDDPKLRALARSTRDEAIIARAIVAYLATLTASWARGDRVSLEDAAPMWLTALDDLAERLQAVDLVDGHGRIPEHSWESWFKPAWERREAKRAGGKLGGQRSWETRSKVRSSIASAEPNPSDPSHPSGPTEPSHSRPSDSDNGRALDVCEVCGRPLGFPHAKGCPRALKVAAR